MRVNIRLLRQLLDQGFDTSHVGGGITYVRCSQCEALVINNVATHERGCPHQTFECRGCNAIVARAGSDCEECR